jgi:putrescine transport system ATP-binding protein
LDKRLREQTQFELMNIQDQLGVTFIVVTHDQEEAMTLSTRIAVMDHGQIIQVGEPSEVYERPQTKDIANFIGTINMFDGEVMSSSDAFLLRCPKISIPLKLPSQTELNIGQQVTLAIRPEKIKMTLEDPHDPSQITLRGEVLEFAYMGNISIYRVKIEEGVVLQITIPNLDRTAERKIEWDDQVFISWHPENSLVLRD